MIATVTQRHKRRRHVQGNWLEAAGFATDTSVVITVEQEQLVIRPVAE
ncbi:SymE family type I addiction module toxin [Pectobacterium peruviense]|nr:SymE family type I addiction module toxin [Pectobacterium peruviense]